MTADTETTLRCNRPGCTTTFGPTNLSRTETRHLAHEYNWAHSGANSDWCPAHATARRQETA